MSEELAKKAISIGENNAKEIGALTKSVTGLIDTLSKTRANGTVNPGSIPGQGFGVPWVREGEDPLSSRGYSFMKMLGVLSGAVPREKAKVELDFHDRLHNVYVKELGNAGYNYKGAGYFGQHKFLAPLGTAYMHEDFVPRTFRTEMRQAVHAGAAGADPQEMNHYRMKRLEGMGYDTKTLSWLNELTGGALVAPPEMGELIELLRNKEALVNAGARTVPLPPQGRMVYPRQTAASLTYWVGENTNITDSDVGTGEVTLQAKKLAVLIKAPNELIRFASPAAEALMRDDMTKSLALGLDQAGLEGAGGDHRPRGIINTQFITTIQASAAAQTTDGDKVFGPDIYRMVAAVEEANAEFEGYIMRPKTLFKFYQLRSDAVGQGDAAGPFLFNLVREAGANTPPTLAGYPVTKSTQVAQNRTKPGGAKSNLTYIVGGMWSDMLIGMFGAIEFAATTQGDTSFTHDQTWVRGILSADIAVRHESAFCLLDNIDTTL